jgi:hypothetical protein
VDFLLSNTCDASESKQTNSTSLEFSGLHPSMLYLSFMQANFAFPYGARNEIHSTSQKFAVFYR